MPSPAFHVRAAGSGDVDALVETRLALFRELGQGPRAEHERAFRAACRTAMERLIGDGSAAAWLAVADGARVLGATFLLEFPRLPSPANLRDREGYALNVYVIPEARRRGIAEALVAAAIAEARARGLARIRLHATDSGRSVYRRLGFAGRDDEMELVL